MKAISFKTLVFFALAANMTLFSCKKKSDDPTPTNNGSNNNANTNSITFVSTTDTLWTAAGDNGTRTFLNGTDAIVYTASQVSSKKIASTIVLGYFFNSDTANYAASITDVYAYPVPYTWDDSSSITGFKTVSLGSANFDTLSQASVEGLYKNSTATPVSAVYKIAQGQVIAFMTASGKYGVLKVNKIVTAWSGTAPDPYSTYMTYSLKMEE